MSDAGEMFGVLAVDKPSGITSRDAVNQVQRLIRPAKVGHTGTLDPLASGVLLLAIGQATRLVEFSHALRKSYVADFLLGLTSDTLDTDGQVTPLANATIVDQGAWQAEMSNWLGEVWQQPPRYSAVHVDGQRAYQLARRGAEFELPRRQVSIFQLELLEFEYPRLRLSVECGSGTYIRCLGHDIARQLGSAAVMSRLVRTRIGNYSLSDCTALSSLVELPDVQRQLTSPLGLLSELEQLSLDDADCQRLRHGLTIVPPTHLVNSLESRQQTCAAIDESGRLVAIVQLQQDRLQPLKVFMQ